MSRLFIILTSALLATEAARYGFPTPGNTHEPILSMGHRRYATTTHVAKKQAAKKQAKKHRNLKHGDNPR